VTKLISVSRRDGIEGKAGELVLKSAAVNIRRLATIQPKQANAANEGLSGDYVRLGRDDRISYCRLARAKRDELEAAIGDSIKCRSFDLI
jgi:hypothetical protein